MIVDEFFAAAAAFDEEALVRVVHPGVRISEMPNAINREGTERDLETARDAFRRGRGLLPGPSFAIHAAVQGRTTISARAPRRGSPRATAHALPAPLPPRTAGRRRRGSP